MLLLDSSRLQRSLRTGSHLLARALHAEALTLTELGKLAESLADFLDGRERAQDRPRTAGTRTSSAVGSFPEDGERPSDATPAAPVESEPVERASVKARDVGGATSAARAGTSEGGSASSVPMARLPTEPTPDDAPGTSGATRSSGALAQTGPSPATAHVDEEMVLVAESADQGAEEGPGASVHVEEPWGGYRQMRAREIIDHLPAVADEVLMLVLLYEPTTSRKRTSVIRAAERELARRSA